jgi:trans-aconitate 2-methyltransferase
MTWDPQQYLKFAQPRLRPALDLLARVELASPVRVCDLGCGAGNVTRVLAARWPQASIVGIDDSAEMLAHANASATATLSFVQADLAAYAPDRPFDLIYSNAALHWSPDHLALFPKLVRDLDHSGVLAVQMPRNFGAPSHLLVADTIRSGPWRTRLEPLLGPAPVMEPARYYDLLAPLASAIDIGKPNTCTCSRGKTRSKSGSRARISRSSCRSSPNQSARSSSATTPLACARRIQCVATERRCSRFGVCSS